MKTFKAFLPSLLFMLGLCLWSSGLPSLTAIGIGLIVLACAMCGPRLRAELGAFPTNCNGRIINVDSSAGCTLTRASITGMTPNTFEAQGFLEIGMDKVYAQAQEARLAGYRESTLMELLNGRITNIKGSLMKQSVRPTESVILPYFPRRQRRNINKNYWAITAGAKNPNAGQGDIPISAWDLTVTNNVSALQGLALQNIDQYFIPGRTLFVEYSDVANNAWANAYAIIMAQTVAGVTKVTVAPPFTANGWSALTAAQQLRYQIGGVNGGNAPTGSIGYIGANAVSDFESFKGQSPAENTNSLINFWWQTSRLTFEYNDEYLKALNATLTSQYFKQFRELPLAEQKRIQMADYERDCLNSFFFGQEINENQTVEGYQNLPQVVDPANPSCVLEYKAHAIGIRKQLANCSRVFDHQGNALNLDNLLATLYLVKRAREADGNTVDTIDIMTDRFTAGVLQDTFIAFYKAKYGVQTTRFYEPDQKLVFDNQVALKYNLYQLPPELGGYNLAVFTHQFFDDKLAAMSGVARGRVLWILDWTDVIYGVGATNSAMRRTNELDQLYNYTVNINVKHISNTSMTWAPIIEDTSRHYIVENFSPTACPVLTVSGCNIATRNQAPA